MRSLAALERKLVRCTKCPRLVAFREQIARDRKKQYRAERYWGKPVPGFGDPQARVLLVGLAPGAHGSNRTGRMFTGDASGDWLFPALHAFGFASQPVAVSRTDGLRLIDCYITAAGRCVPPGNKPTALELATCRPYLEREIRLLTRVRIVIGLGRIGHEHWMRAAGWWSRLAPRDRPRFGHGVEHTFPNGTVLIGSYHPSRQNTNTGKLTRRMWHAVFRRARTLADGAR